ncbi:MAG TPA: hypothetical protein PK156_08880 [Polyangium sp.]|nr:hypothetical protein [Polyangium sp.]
MSGDFPLRMRDHAPASQALSAVVLVRDELQFHLGLLRSAEPPEHVLHLAWHRILRDEPLQKVIVQNERVLPSAAILLALDPVIDEALRFLAQRVARKHANRWGDLAYGFGPTDTTFQQQTGKPTDPDAAFTCATFVLALLRSVGIQLVDAARWRTPTEEDMHWQRTIGKQLLDWIAQKIHGDLPRMQARVERDIGSLRFRPTDVAGAACCAADTWPVGANNVDPHAQSLISRLS